jgi:hypothetical protein
MKEARFSMQFAINYHQNRGKRLKEGSFQTPVYSAMHDSIFYTKTEALPLVSLIFFFASLPSMFYQPISVARCNIRVL